MGPFSSGIRSPRCFGRVRGETSNNSSQPSEDATASVQPSSGGGPLASPLAFDFAAFSPSGVPVLSEENLSVLFPDGIPMPWYVLSIVFFYLSQDAHFCYSRLLLILSRFIQSLAFAGYTVLFKALCQRSRDRLNVANIGGSKFCFCSYAVES